MRKIKVAFGLDEGGNLANKHYGDSDKFAIYEFSEDGTYRFIENRENKARDLEEHQHGDPRKFQAVISQLNDVDVIAGYWFGPNFVRIKKNSDKLPILTKTRSLKEAITKISKNFENIWQDLSEKRSKIK
ncbi:MAG: NifB/NifX family molybdenum-iron cluster-binding protein [Candidatus Njordarchaeia archaeon]